MEIEAVTSLQTPLRQTIILPHRNQYRFKCALYLEHFYSFPLPSDSLFKQGTEAKVYAHTQPPRLFLKNRNFSSQDKRVADLLLPQPLASNVNVLKHRSHAIRQTNEPIEAVLVE